MIRLPKFQPHRLLRSGHLQTIAAALFGGRRYPYRATPVPIVLENGDTTFLHDDRPDDWTMTSPVALLVHGLAGCHLSPYMVRIAGKLNSAGVRTFRMDMRACGAGEGLASLPYHAGCRDDLLAAIWKIVELCPAAPIHLVGFSIGGNAALKLLGEAAGKLPPQLCRAVVFNPPVDLETCVANLSFGASRFYDRYLTRLLYGQLRRSDRLIERAPHVVDAQRPRGQRELDSMYTAGVWGFETVDQFYADNSSVSVIPNIRIPTLLIASRDDPLVPVQVFEQLDLPASITMHLTDHGGHLGYIGGPKTDPDQRWMDWRIMDWISADFPQSSGVAA